MCSSTLYEWYDSLEKGVKDPNICRLPEGDRQASLVRISSGRDADLKVEWLTGSPPSCVDGKKNEDYKCGYLNEDVACKNQCPEAKCGQGQSGSRLLPSGSSESNTSAIAIIGGVVGGVAFIGLLGFAVYLKKQRGKDDPKLDLKNLPDLHSSAINSTAQTPMSPQSGPSYNPSPLFTPQPVDGYQQQAPASSLYSPPLQPSPPSPTKQQYNQSLQLHNAASPAYVSNESVSSVVKVATGEYLQPRNQDEIVVKKGDKVLIKEMFDDGWALGTNLSTGMEGIFPMSPFNETSSSVSGSASSPTQSQFVPPNGPQHLQNQPQFQQNHPMRISETSTSSAGSGGGMPIYQVHNNLPQPQHQYTNSQIPAQSIHTPRPVSFTPIQNQGQSQPQAAITSSLGNPNYQLYNYQQQH
ncbi:hypothetical protein BKA69DRAFT_1045820 [Paraphysoderma sedebokerense]|nr:hypothetical protein BKA69DRAFT_1045820 [Paraphysoderma sedebokerense]